MSYFMDKTHYVHYTLKQEFNVYKPSLKWHLWLYMTDNNRASFWYKTKAEALAIIEHNFTEETIQ